MVAWAAQQSDPKWIEDLGLPFDNTMSLAEKIGAEIRNAKASDRTIHISDFQVRVTDNGAVLINLKTGAAQLIAVDKSDYALGLQSVVQ